MTNKIPSNENIARFLTHKSKYSKENNLVKKSAFIAPKEYPTELSIIRIDGLVDAQIN
jgi:hypothetical protein